MKNIITIALLALAITVQAQSDSSQLAVFNTGRNITVLSADFGAALTQDLIGELVMAYDTVMVLKAHTVRDSSGKFPMRHESERRATKISNNLKDKIAVIDYNKDYDVTQMALNVQKAGAKALIIIHESDDKKQYKLAKKGTYKDSIRIPVFTIPNKKGEQIQQLLPSMSGIKKPTTTPQNSSSRLILNLEAAAEVTRARVNWVNNTGSTTDYFIVQKLNPKTGMFEDLLTVNSHPNDDLESYTQYDNNPVEGENIYRIQLVGTDGSLRYSDLKTVLFYASNGVTLFPNPADDLLNILFKGYLGQDVDIAIFDMQGKSVLTQHIDKLQSETQTLVIADKTTVGQYMIVIKSKGKRDVMRQFTVGK